MTKKKTTKELAGTQLLEKEPEAQKFDALKYCMELFKVREDNVFVFKDLGDRFALHTKDAKKYVLPKHMIK